MDDPEKFALATHFYVRMRRAANRVVDATWMANNDEYAREILKLARGCGDPELASLASRFEALMPGASARRTLQPKPVPAAAAPAPAPATTAPQESDAAPNSQNYIGALR